VNNLVFLLLAVVVSGVGVLVLWLRHRPPSSPTASIDEFRGKMRALAPDEDGPDGPHDPDEGSGRPVRRRRGA
jgi:hypothetical protein